MLEGKRILLVISGGIAAYKSLDLIRRLRERGAEIRTVMTEGATHLVTPLAVAALSENRVATDMWALTPEGEIGHIRLARDPDLVVVAPATANLLAKMAHGIADDLASTLLLATDKPVLVAPAMNVVMWEKAVTQANVAALRSRGVHQVGPGVGEMACKETGAGRMAEVSEIVSAVEGILVASRSLAGIRALVTSGPTHEPLDPVRFLGNRSSGKQGHAIASALAELGADVTLVSGPVALPDPLQVRVTHVETAEQMLAACQAALPVDVAVCAAAVADWRPERVAAHKRKKVDGPAPVLALVENPDILAIISRGAHRPRLVVGFAAETDDLEGHARTKLARKGCDWIIANDVTAGSGTFGGDANTVVLVTVDGLDRWPTLSKAEVARRLAGLVARHFSG
ncbi:MAG TPA: bifunctional phosphopantothenoylcysteine decarboxylase/phosphopantothenate--cysteine ligase CoaBC [Thermoanaerobaculaceae bacterium]|nr:bifunctional phosphopantothenoylcysteine decarboxylase/phosphopantothenate--cysteine ligase CoaBC [Thermoanaerobaculaceae bacterium]